MCDICGAYEGHEARCPYYTSQSRECAECGGYVEGEKYVEIGDKVYHLNCLADMDFKTVVDIVEEEYFLDTREFLFDFLKIEVIEDD